MAICGVAGGGGFEPPPMEPESIVLPLDDPPKFILAIGNCVIKVKIKTLPDNLLGGCPRIMSVTKKSENETKFSQI
jgi:hypothetical protein